MEIFIADVYGKLSKKLALKQVLEREMIEQVKATVFPNQPDQYFTPTRQLHNY